MRGKILKNVNGVKFYKAVNILFDDKKRVIVMDPDSENVLIDCGLDFYNAEKEKKRILELRE